jgi:hypothetical protein
MFGSINIEKFNLIERFGNWFWTMNGKDVFFGFVILGPILTAITIPYFAYIVWSNPLISGVIIAEMLYLEYWKDRCKKPTKSERLQKENDKLRKTVGMQKLILEQKMSTIENLICENRKLRNVIVV